MLNDGNNRYNFATYTVHCTVNGVPFGLRHSSFPKPVLQVILESAVTNQLRLLAI